MLNPIILPTRRDYERSSRWMGGAGTAICMLASGLAIIPVSCKPEDAAANFFCLQFSVYSAQVLSTLLLTLGAALIGSSLSQLATSRKASDLLDDIATVIDRSVAQPALYSADKDVALFRKKWFSYHVTTREGKIAWRAGIIDFSASPTIDRLLTNITMVDEAGQPDASYVCEAFVRGSTLAMVVQPIHKEHTFMRLFPDAGKQYRSAFWGISAHETLDGKDGLHRSIMSLNPLFGVDTPRLVEEKETVEKFFQYWEHLLTNSNWANRL